MPSSDHTTNQPTERPDLTAWRRRHELRRSNAAQPVKSGRTYSRKTKHDRDRHRRDA